MPVLLETQRQGSGHLRALSSWGAILTDIRTIQTVLGRTTA